MLGRLFSPGRSATGTESFIEEAHTRSLIFPSHEPTYSPSGNNDAPDLSGVLPFDYTRFELNETRCLIAQDASASQNACILFDSKANRDATPSSPPVAHRRGNSSVFGRAPQLRQPPALSGTRNRSSTLSNPPMQETETKDHTYTGMLLECMFGAPSTAKGGNSTKMHIINSDSDLSSHITTRIPINRSQTYGNSSTVQTRPAGPSEYSEPSSHYDVVLVTRTFSVILPDDVRETSASANTITSPDGYFSPQQKATKLKRTKSPAFAVAIIVRLPPLTPLRPVSRHLSSASSSHSSSWTLLEALPSSLASPRCLVDRADNRIEQFVENFPIIERSLLALEQVAKFQITELLKVADNQALSTVAKAPKEKSMQRTNQRFVQLIPDSLQENEKIRTAAMQALNRTSHGAKITRVCVGLGLLPGGRFLEEFRTLSRSCPTVFVYKLLTAYLGLISPDWLARLKRSRGHKLEAQDPEVQNSRTVIVCEDRSTARRLVFLLASFLEGRGDAFNPVANARAAVPTKAFALHSPPSSVSRRGSLRRTALSRSNAESSDAAILSSSPSSILGGGSSHLNLTQPPILRKPSTTSTPTITPVPATPVPYLTDSYFPPTETKDSAASLANLLRRSSSHASSNAPSQGSTKWGSLLSGFFRADSASTSVSTVPDSRKASTESPALEILNPKVQSKDISPAETKSVVPGLQRSASTDKVSISLPQPIPPRLKVDQNDGVIDVDVSSIPGFLSSSDTGIKSPVPLMSPRTPSMRSFDGNSSMHSARSHADAFSNKQPPDLINAAGFLKSYHQDFMLQAVKSYPDLVKEVKASMSSEQTPRGLCLQASADEPPRWVNVSTTLIANVRELSLTRVQLKRRIADLSSSTKSGGKFQSNTSFPVKPELDTPDSASSEPPEEAFFSETVHGFDKTLADAIDRALDPRGSQLSSGASQSTHSRTASSTSSTAAGKTPPAAPRVIVDALQEVVESVDRELHHKDSATAEHQGLTTNTMLKPGAKEENALREGVKRWMECVEHREVW